MAYRHGAYGNVIDQVAKAPEETPIAPVYFGVAPVHTVRNGAQNVNRPEVAYTFQEAVSKWGYSDDWATYPLCEAMHLHLRVMGTGPLIFVNVLDVEKIKSASDRTEAVTVKNGRAYVLNAESVVLDSLVVTGKELDVDYTATYDYTTKRIEIREKKKGLLTDGSLSVTMATVDPTAVETEDVIGESDGQGVNTGLYALLDVYQLTGIVPFYILAPGYSQEKEVHDAMASLCRQINGHWNARIFTDIPLVVEGEPVTLTKAQEWAEQNGYNLDYEKPHFPKYKSSDGRIYHLSVIEAAVKQQLDNETGGIPYESASNKALPLEGKLYFGEGIDMLPDVETLNEKLCQYGITTAAFVAGRWAIWGTHMGSYNPTNETDTNRFDVALMVMDYVTNDFQMRRGMEVDTQMTKNRVEAIISEEMARLDGLKAIGAITFGECYVETAGSFDVKTDYAKGHVLFLFRVTPTPLVQSVTALVMYTDDGLAIYTEEVE